MTAQCTLARAPPVSLSRKPLSPVPKAVLEKYFRDLSLKNKFSRKWENKI